MGPIQQEPVTRVIFRSLTRITPVVLFLTAAGYLNCARTQVSSVNFRHLEHLTEPILFAGDTVDIIHVYANYPDYRWYEAADSGMEGIACVDDAARAAVVYLRHYQLTHEARSLSRARRLLGFILNMQSADGEFYNFILSDHSVNRTGKTSIKSFGWWASRGVWSLGLGCAVFRDADPRFAEQLNAAFRRSLPHVHALLLNYGRSEIVAGYRVPRWLPYESGGDVTSELTLGLVEFYASDPDTSLRSAIEKLTSGITMMQDGTVGEYPYGLHRSWETMWHMWGNSQTQVLATAGKVLSNASMVASAEREAEGFYSRLLVDGYMKEFDVARPSSIVRYEQIAYAVRPMAVGLIRLYEATGKREYLEMAGLAASWLLGNNVLHEPLYDGSTGRGYDGISDSVTMNRNSGAESTIEALYTLVEVEHYPEARHYLTFTKVSTQFTTRYHTALFRNSAGEEATVGVDLAGGSLVVLENEASMEFQKALQR
jgi:hypothetical protein